MAIAQASAVRVMGAWDDPLRLSRGLGLGAELFDLAGVRIATGNGTRKGLGFRATELEGHRSGALVTSLFRAAAAEKASLGEITRDGFRIPKQAVRLSQRSRTQKQPNASPFVVRAATQIPQNVDLPLVLPKKKKKPKASRKRVAKKKYTKRPLESVLRAPENGLLVQRLIPIAHDVLEAKAILTKGVDLLVKAIPVWTCRFCTEVHVALVGHALQTCQGPANDQRHSLHAWVKATINEVLLPVEAYHLFDRLALPMTHADRFDLERISAVEELCIQAGVDFPEYPTRRYSEPTQSPLRKLDARGMGDEFADQEQGSFEPSDSTTIGQLEETSLRGAEDVVDTQIGVDDCDIGRETLIESGEDGLSKHEIIPLVDVTSEDDLKTIAEKTLQAWERMRAGAKKLKSKYRVVVCGYCPEVHVGSRGHSAQVCGAFKHQWRNGQHGWQTASVDDFIPPQYVWHVRDRNGPPLCQALRRFYGKAPAVVELCLQAGASLPDRHKPLMRLDIVIPNIEELEHVI